jgi:hypothetical protein
MMVEIACVTLDRREPARLAHFWSAALGWDDIALDEDGISATCTALGGDVYLEFVRVPEPKSSKNRVHLGRA